MLHFETIDQLKTWLASKGVDTSQWGVSGAKSVENLWAELVARETEIQDDPPLRLVRLVNVIIRQGDRILVEATQEFGENQQRERGGPPAEKIKPGESPVETALRCLQEELRVDPSRVEIVAVLSEPEPKTSDSPSYPGLRTCYLQYVVEAKVTGLPSESFWTTEAVHEDGDPVHLHQWLWKIA
jgi:ADP-ribose pyrophosphatase YjhB (NUDIX family)